MCCTHAPVPSKGPATTEGFTPMPALAPLPSTTPVSSTTVTTTTVGSDVLSSAPTAPTAPTVVAPTVVVAPAPTDVPAPVDLSATLAGANVAPSKFATAVGYGKWFAGGITQTVGFVASKSFGFAKEHPRVTLAVTAGAVAMLTNAAYSWGTKGEVHFVPSNPYKQQIEAAEAKAAAEATAKWMFGATALVLGFAGRIIQEKLFGGKAVTNSGNGGNGNDAPDLNNNPPPPPPQNDNIPNNE